MVENLLKLKEGSLRIFLNTTATELSTLDQKLQAFYHYLRDGVADSTLTQEIFNKITTLKNNSLERRSFMTLALKMADARYDGYEEGFDEGFTAGREDGLQQGRDQGAYEKALETARAMYLDKVPVETISKYTNLPLDVIQTLH